MSNEHEIPCLHRIIELLPSKEYTSLCQVNGQFRQTVQEVVESKFSALESQHEAFCREIDGLDIADEDLQGQADFDQVTELFDKVADGIDVFKEHADDRTPLGIKLGLQLQMLTRIQDAFLTLRQSVRAYRAKDESKKRSDRSTNEFATRSLDRFYGDVHAKFITAYLKN